MKDKVNTSFWREDSLLSTYPKLKEKMHTDVCIIGGGVSSLAGYLKIFLPQGNKKPKRKKGNMTQCGFKKVAIYKDANGNIKLYSGFCSHLGGILTWNDLDKSWDCPAHGSRFNSEGKILNVPSMKNLKVIPKMTKCSMNGAR